MESAPLGVMALEVTRHRVVLGFAQLGGMADTVKRRHRAQVHVRQARTVLVNHLRVVHVPHHHCDFVRCMVSITAFYLSICLLICPFVCL